MRKERDSLAKIYLSVSFELSEIRAPVRGRERALCLLQKKRRRERDSRAPTSLRSPTSNAYGCRWYPGQTKMKILHTQLFVFFTSHAFKQAWAWDTKKTSPNGLVLHFGLRRERDSNPRSLSAQRFSRPPQSTTLPSLLCSLSKFGAQDETRTHTVLRPLPPQSSVYTNFTTCASSEFACRMNDAW